MEPTITLDARRVTRILVLGILVVLAGHLYVVFSHFVLHWQVRAATELFDMDLEANLPAFFSAFLFFVGAILFHLAGRGEQGRTRRSWNLMALIFAFLGVDEGSQIHEKLIFAMWRLMDQGQQTRVEMGWLYHAWVIPYGIAAIVLLAMLVPFLFRLPKATRNGLILSGVVYVLGAVFLEMYGGHVSSEIEGMALTPEQMASLPCEIYPDTTCGLYANGMYVMLYTLEEVTEMLGLVFCINTLTAHLGRAERGLRIRFKRAEGSV